MTNPGDVFRFAVGEDCCPFTCNDCLSFNYDDLLLDSTGMNLATDYCVDDCAVFEDIFTLEYNAFNYPLCRFIYEFPGPICDAAWQWDMWIDVAADYCRMRIYLQAGQGALEEHYYGTSSVNPIDLSDWITVPYVSSEYYYPWLHNCPPGEGSELKIKRA